MGAGALGAAGGIRMAVRLTITARKLKPLIRKQVPSPTTASSSPAMAGPTTRAALNTAELSEMALIRSSLLVIWITSAWRPGMSKALITRSDQRVRHARPPGAGDPDDQHGRSDQRQLAQLGGVQRGARGGARHRRTAAGGGRRRYLLPDQRFQLPRRDRQSDGHADPARRAQGPRAHVAAPGGWLPLRRP